jgi:hypothetical protein
MLVETKARSGVRWGAGLVLGTEGPGQGESEIV